MSVLPFDKSVRLQGKRIVLPVDNEAGNSFSNDCLHITVHSQEIPDGFEGMDIGLSLVSRLPAPKQ